MNAAAPLAVALPLFMAAMLPFIELAGRRRLLLDSIALLTAGAVTALDVILLAHARTGLIVYWFGGWVPVNGITLGVSFSIDLLGAGFAAFTGLLTMLALLYTWHYFESIGPYFQSLMLVFLAAMTGFCLTGDLFNMFVFFELMGVAAYALTGYHIEQTGPLEGALNFSVMNSIGAVSVLSGIAMVYSRTGALNMAQAGKALAGRPADFLVFAAFGLMFTGFFVKAAVAPFHFWLPDAHTVAPTPVSVLFSGVMVEMGIYAVARVYWTVFHISLAAYDGQLRAVLAGIGVITCLLGGIMSFAQRHLKRMLAFSTVSHAGIMVIGIAMLDPRALAGAFLYIMGHGFVKGGLFILAGVLLHKFGSVDEIDLRGMGRKTRLTASAFIIAGFALAGLPPFGPFLGKSMIEEAAKSLGYDWLYYVFILGSALTGGAVLRAGAGIFMGWGRPSAIFSSSPFREDTERPETQHRRRMHWVLLAPAIVMIFLSFLSGIAPRLVKGTIMAAYRFLDTAAYQSGVLGASVKGAHGWKLNAGAYSPDLKSYMGGFASAAIAVIFAAAALSSHRLTKKTRSAIWDTFGPCLDVLRKLHSGLIEDYVVWFMAGSALILGALALIAIGKV